jgi:Na+/H+-translocating membrane pyrophosphatase
MSHVIYNLINIVGVINIVKYDTTIGKLINQLDITGNTMSAVVKGFSSGSAGLVSFGLYGAIMLSANVYI